MEMVDVRKYESSTVIEVFKTNVADWADANMLLERIHEQFLNYEANFDLEDCDRILRVKSFGGSVQSPPLIALLNDFGFRAEILPDTPVHGIFAAYL
jgi:hypothetical protein